MKKILKRGSDPSRRFPPHVESPYAWSVCVDLSKNMGSDPQRFFALHVETPSKPDVLTFGSLLVLWFWVSSKRVYVQDALLYVM